MRTVESWNSKETVRSEILVVFVNTLSIGQVEKRSVNVGFVLQVKRTIQLPPGFILVSVKAPLSGSTRLDLRIDQQAA